MKKVNIMTYAILFIMLVTTNLYASERDFFDIARSGTLEEVEEAIFNGANVNMRAPSGITPLTEAVLCKNDLNVVRTLLT
jgi:ankyrin repeat protein